MKRSTDIWSATKEWLSLNCHTLLCHSRGRTHRGSENELWGKPAAPAHWLSSSGRCPPWEPPVTTLLTSGCCEDWRTNTRKARRTTATPAGGEYFLRGGCHWCSRPWQTLMASGGKRKEKQPLTRLCASSSLGCLLRRPCGLGPGSLSFPSDLDLLEDKKDPNYFHRSH